MRLRSATATCERLLARGFLEAPDASALPAPVVRAITGGLHGVLARRLTSAGDALDASLAEQMVSWTMVFQTPAATGMAERMTEHLTRRMREISLASAHRRAVELGRGEPRDDRERLLDNALRLAALHDYRELTAPQIADEARVPIDAFLELFADKDICFMAGLDMIGEELLAIAQDGELAGGDWPVAVRRVVGALMAHLAERPLYTRIIAQEAFFAGPGAIARNLALAERLATLLTAGAPEPARCELAVDAIAGAFLHVLRCQVTSGRIQMLAALSDYFAYVVLAPFIGADAAVAALASDPAA